MAGFFNKSVAPQAEAAPPLSRDRIAAVLDADGANYSIDDDGDIGGYWDTHLFFFLLFGEEKEILQIRGRYSRDIPDTEFDKVLALANTWHGERMYPTIHVRKSDDGTLGVFSMQSIDYEYGVTDDGLRLHFTSAINGGGTFFDQLDEVYPEAAAAARARFEE